MPILELQNLKKYFATQKAVDDISFSADTGSIFGLLGPNGAGKTTLIRMITGIFYPDSGNILFDNRKFDPVNDVVHIGYMPEERGLYKKMKIGEQALYLAQLKGLKRSDAMAKIKEWFIKFEMESWWNKKVEDLSKGMSQKLQFVTTVLHEPKLIILDEPFSGLDPVNSNLIKEEIYRLAQKGSTIIFSTHRMEQVEEICDHIVLINKGQKILDGSVKQVKNNFSKYGLLDDNVKFLKGWFKDTLPVAPINKLALLRLDGDMYESTMDGLVNLYPKLSKGGYIIVDDWGAVEGCKLAVLDYRKKHGITEEIITIDWTGVYWKKEN